MIRAVLSRVALTAGVVAALFGMAAPAAAAPPAPPGNLRVTDRQPESLAVAWDVVPAATSYSLQLIALEGVCAPNFRRLTTTDLATTWGGLTWDCPYKVTVRAYVPSNWPDAWSDVAVLTTTTSLPAGYVQPGPPSNLRIDGDTLRWDAATVGFGLLTYQVYADVPNIPEFDGPQPGRTAGTSRDISDFQMLEPGQTAAFRVTTIDRAWNESAPSAPVVLTR